MLATSFLLFLISPTFPPHNPNQDKWRVMERSNNDDLSDITREEAKSVQQAAAANSNAAGNAASDESD